MHTRGSVVVAVAFCSLLTSVCLLPPAAAAEEAREPEHPHAEMALGANRIDWQPASDYEALVLTVAGPGGLWLSKEFEAGQPASLSLFDPAGSQLPEGAYSYELQLVPRQAGDRSERPLRQSGSFAIREGSFAASFEPATKPEIRNVTAATEVIPEDLVVQGNACVGDLCTSVNPYGAAIQLKDYYGVGISFEDVYDGITYSRDWLLQANGLQGDNDRFFLVDIDAGTIPVSVYGDSPENTLVLRSGKVGIGTALPAASLHVNAGEVRLPPGSGGAGGFTHFNYSADGKNYIRGTTILVDIGGKVGIGTASPAALLDVKANAPTLAVDRLQNTSGSGYSGTEYLDNAGNVDLFFGVDNAASTTRLNSVNNNPIVILTNSAERMRVTSAGDIGIGTASPAGALHVSRSSGAVATIARFSNDSGVQMLFDRTDAGANDWQMSNFNSTFQISIPGSSPGQLNLASNGNLAISGTLSQGSSREIKTNFEPLDPINVLERVNELPISVWSYKQDTAARHLGPMAEDFHKAFGLGIDDQTIAPGDTAGVALAAIKGLHQVVAASEAEIAALRRENSGLAEKVAALEKLVSSLVSEEGSEAAAEPAP